MKKIVSFLMSSIIVFLLNSCDFMGKDNGSDGPPVNNTSLTAPTNLQASQGTYNNCVKISWDAVPGAQSYKVLTSTSDPVQSYSSTLFGTTFTTAYDFSVNTTDVHYYAVMAYSTSDASGPSSPISSSMKGYASSTGVVKDVPVPTNVKATQGAFSDKVTITWDKVPEARNYTISRGYSSDTVGVVDISGNNYVTNANNSSFDHSTISSNKFYYVIKTVTNGYTANGVISSCASSPAAGWISGSPVDQSLAAPVVTGYVSTNNLNLSWNAVSGASEYRYYYSETENGTYKEYSSTTSTSSSIYINNTTIKSTTYFKIKAFAESGTEVTKEGLFSNWIKGDGSTASGLGGPQTITGAQISSGTYAFAGISYTFNSGNSCTKSFGGNSYTGTWGYSGGKLTTSTVYESAGVMKMEYIETFNGGYTLDSGNKLFLYSWKKTVGADGTIIGTYEYSYSIRLKMYSWGGSWTLDSDLTTTSTATIEYKADNTWTSSITMSISPDDSTTDPTNMYPFVTNANGTWAASDFSSGTIKFVDYNGSKYLYTGDAGAYVKQ